MVRLFLTVLILLPATLRADVPRVATDIAPVHSLVARVMEGVGEPDLLLQPGASPHGYALRPSEAAAVQAADLVVWIGPELTPWLDRALESLGADASQLVLLRADGTLRHPTRESAAFAHDRHDEHHDDHHAAHDDDHGEGHHDDDMHEDEGHDRAEHDPGHDHGAIDPHAWLDPENARLWIGLIAAELARIDPENAEAYAENADAAGTELADLAGEIGRILAPVQDMPFLVYHDAYQYFERRFGLNTVGAIAVSDANAPGAARMAELRDLVQDSAPRCAFYEPQFSPKLVDALAQGTGLQQAELDPLGQALEPGPGFYPQLLHEMAQRIANCR